MAATAATVAIRPYTSRRTGKVKIYSYTLVGGVPAAEYFRQKAHARYTPHPNQHLKAKAPQLSDEQSKQIIQLSTQGLTQREIIRRLSTSKYRVQKVLGTR